MTPLIETSELSARLGQPGLTVLDASWYLPSEKRDAATEYRDVHIPGAMFFDIDAVSDASSGLPHTLAQPAAFEMAARALGINSGDEIVIYDTAGLFSAARAWWNFRVAGHTKVRVLNGGLPAWQARSLPVETGIVTRATGDFVAHYDYSLVRSFDDMLRYVQEGGPAIVDARGAPRFRGDVAEPRPGLKSGHITGSHNLPYANLIADCRLKSPAELRAAFESAGVNPADPIVTTCGSGVTASILVLALAVMGRTDVPVYDGSWSEWGRKAESAGFVETGA